MVLPSSFGIGFLALSSPKKKTDYGITTSVNSYNPITLNFHEWADILKDVRRSKSVKEAYFLVFGRPSKLEELKKQFREKTSLGAKESLKV